jgi:hypothetical protein
LVNVFLKIFTYELIMNWQRKNTVPSDYLLGLGLGFGFYLVLGLGSSPNPSLKSMFFLWGGKTLELLLLLLELLLLMVLPLLMGVHGIFDPVVLVLHSLELLEIRALPMWKCGSENNKQKLPVSIIIYTC